MQDDPDGHSWAHKQLWPDTERYFWAHRRYTRETPNGQHRHTTQTWAWVPKAYPTDITVTTQTLAYTEHTTRRLGIVIGQP